MLTSVELRQQRAKLVHDARGILDAAEKVKRPLTAEETESFDRQMDAADNLETEFLRLEKLERAEGSLDTAQERRASPVAPGTPPGPDDQAEPTIEELAKTLPPAVAGVLFNSSPDERANFRRRAGPAYRKIHSNYLATGYLGAGNQRERLALQADVDISGGYMTAPLQFVAELIKFVDDSVFMRQWATKHTVASAQSLGAPSLDTDIADADWTSEIKTGSADTAMATGRRDLHPHPLAKRIRVSNKLLRLSTIGAEALVRDRLGYKIAITEEKAFLSGHGSGQALGVFTASATGISTSRDVSTGNTTTAIGADGLIEAKYALKGQYQMSATTRWIFHRDAVKQIRKLKDANGQYLWSPGIAGAAPDRILDVPFAMSEYAPNTFTTGLYVGIIGDFRFYWIADALSVTIQRLVELYAETNEVGFISRAEVDGMPVLEEAFARVKLA